jgi:ribosomal protein S27E
MRANFPLKGEASVKRALCCDEPGGRFFAAVECMGGSTVAISTVFDRTTPKSDCFGCGELAK